MRREDRKLSTRDEDGGRDFSSSGYAGGGLQMQTDIAVDPAGNVWAMNNWEDVDSCFGYSNEALSTRCGQGVVVFYEMAKPVRAPQIGPSRPYKCKTLTKNRTNHGLTIISRWMFE